MAVSACGLKQRIEGHSRNLVDNSTGSQAGALGLSPSPGANELCDLE